MIKKHEDILHKYIRILNKVILLEKMLTLKKLIKTNINELKESQKTEIKLTSMIKEYHPKNFIFNTVDNTYWFSLYKF